MTQSSLNERYPRQAVSPRGSCSEANQGTAMDVGGWLRALGLEQYEAAFRENEISEKVLPNLTAEDLKDLGVGLFGHRRMLLDAIVLQRAGQRHHQTLAQQPTKPPRTPPNAARSP